MTCHIQEVRVDYQKWAFGALKSRTLWNIEKHYELIFFQ